MNKIRDLRVSKGLKQSDLAKMLNCSHTAISNYETGFRDIDSVTIGRLCDIFGCTADYLLGRSELPTPEISAEEARLLQAYRRADGRARDMVDLALAPFAQESSEQRAI